MPLPSAADIQLAFGDIDPDLWESLSDDQPLPLQQHWAYGQTLKAIGADIQQLTLSQSSTPIAIALVGKRRFYRIIRMNSLMRGPLWLPGVTKDEQAAGLKALRKHHSPWRWNFMLFQPELVDTPENRAVLKAAGYRRIMTGYSTIWTDLGPSVDTLRASLNAKWRNQLTKAESSGKLETVIGGRKQHQYTWLTDREADQQTRRGYQAVPIGLVPIYAGIAERFAKGDDSVGVMSVTALAGRKKVAGAIFMLHGNSATYHVGWSGDEGRNLNAQNKVLWDGIVALKERGIRFLDLGGLNTADGAGIARFKLGLGTDPLTLAGTWL
jgi:hypothetical protein